MILKTIKDRLDVARKKHAPEAAMLSLLYSNCLLIAKGPDKNHEITDEKVIAVVKRLQKGLIETKDMAVNRTEVIEKCNRELKILEEFLPKQLSYEELDGAVKNFIATLQSPSPRDMGKVMSMLKEKYNGRYDGKVASEIVRKYLV